MFTIHLKTVSLIHGVICLCPVFEVPWERKIRLRV